MNYDKIGAFIATKRKEKNLTQKDLAKLLGVTDKAVSKWERGLGCPDVSLLEILANALDVSILEIFKGRIIENEVIPITEANDYVLETVNYTNNEVKKKYDRLVQNIITFIIVAICSLLVFLNVYHIIYLNKTESYDFSNSDTVIEMKNKIKQIEINLNKLKNNQSIYELDDKNILIDFLEKTIDDYQNLSIMDYKGTKKFKLKDLYLLDMETPSYLNFIHSYRTLLKYDNSLEEDVNLYIKSKVAKIFIGNNLYSEPGNAYQYQLNYINVSYADKILPRLLNIDWQLEEILYFSSLVIKVGEINE